MSGLFGSLNQSVRALTAQSIGVETAGRNLANVNNPDYARQRVVFGDRGTVITAQGAQSLGLEAMAVSQLRDALLDNQVVRETGLSASLSAQAKAYAKTQASLGESIDRTASPDGSATLASTGIAAALSTFFNAFNSLAARPTDLGERQNLVQQAEVLAERIRITDTRLGRLQTDLSSEISTDADETTRLLASVAELNAQIGRFEVNAPGSAVDLRDQRQSRLEQLAGKLSFETRPTADAPGQLDILVRNTDGDPVTLVTRATATAVTFDGEHLRADGQPLALAGGSIAGLLTARDGPVETLRGQLDSLASQLAASVNAAYAPAGGAFFTVTPGSAAASLRLAPGLTATTLRTAPAGAAAGDNTLALAVANLATHRFTTPGGDAIDGTFAQFYTGAVGDLGRAVSGATDRLADQTNIETLVRTQRDAVSGVSMDEEMTDLMKYQRAFQASSRVISVIDELLNTVVNGMGR